MVSTRTLLILEGVKKAMRKWKKVHKRLHKATRKGFKQYQRRVDAWEAQRPGETDDQHVERLRTQAGDVDQSIHDRVFAKHREKIRRLDAEERRRREKVERLEAKRRAKASIPSLGRPVSPATVRTIAAAGRVAPRVAAMTKRPKKMFSLGR